MIGIARALCSLLLTAWLVVLGAWSAHAETEVDLALVLAVDVSLSMEPDEQELQRQGFVDAFHSPEVHEAIGKGMLGRIAVTYVEWAGAGYQQVIVPWTVIEHPADSHAFAGRLAQTSLHRFGYTSISGAIDFSLKQLRESGVTPVRQVIDVSGDGANNQGRIVTAARDEAVAQGVTINGLPLMLKRPDGMWDIDNLDLYFRDCVIGGSGAFMIPVREKHQIAQAVRTKVVREIAAKPQARSLVHPAQAEERANCLAGELRRHQRSGN
ncbi:DUF1194 domain-containing protein [Microvirga soli]|jgi:hypothetical protein|uniref:DUF1194 domain-containing protein n=1 Tax=Microvirga soli TaxID=1854496 RepID=UPI00191DECDA|nr:DUF1194 domain-containing protein [Microvirga soli]